MKNPSVIEVRNADASHDTKLCVRREAVRALRVRTGIQTGGGGGNSNGGATEIVQTLTCIV